MQNEPHDKTQSDRNDSPFHRGEHDVQARLGVRDIEQWARQVIRHYLPEQHRQFYTTQPFLIVSARDKAGQPWVTLLHNSGSESFVTSPDPQHLVIKAARVKGDALEHACESGADVGILGIEPVTRRRNRVNGRVVAVDSETFTFRVEQSFGNCPQYIHQRATHLLDEKTNMQVQRGTRLSQSQQKWIAAADTFFIASGYRGEGESASFGMDASHRGGEPGFVNVLSDTHLSFPDYAGNNHFNTFGNLVLDARVGLLFVDIKTGSLLQLSGTAIIDWNPEQARVTAGTRRLVEIKIEHVVELTNALPLRWHSDEPAIRSLRVIDKITESRGVTSFLLEAEDGEPLADFEPGQHLPIKLSVAGVDDPVSRTYSLSNAPGGGHYRITVKRTAKGLASRHLHDHVEPGDMIESRAPAGDFVMTSNLCPLVLVSAGVGITPMLSILQTVAAQSGDRKVWFVHGARDTEHHPFAEEVRSLVAKHSNIKLHVAYSRPGLADVLNQDYHSTGRVDGDLLSSLVNDTDAHYFLCGPTGFMAGIQSDLQRRSVSIEQIHHETFGPVDS
ncbi:MAG: pyridoxamine 5'-phosphate oxidase family protein [Arenicella sp.]|nr:pyridoxamine 5'-phosphate oxidase family protein [Arenicella sp.]